jgi:hypothetical protein
MYTPNLYNDVDLDQGVALAAGAYRVQWGEYGSSYWKTPTPPDIYYEYIYIFDWEIPTETIKVEVDALKNYVRTGHYLEQAFLALQESFGDAEISVLPLYENGNPEPENWFMVCVAGVTTVNKDLDTAKWQAVGIWGLENLYASLSSGYLKLNKEEPGVFLIDENTFLVL